MCKHITHHLLSITPCMELAQAFVASTAGKLNLMRIISYTNDVAQAVSCRKCC